MWRWICFENKTEANILEIFTLFLHLSRMTVQKQVFSSQVLFTDSRQEDVLGNYQFRASLPNPTLINPPQLFSLPNPTLIKPPHTLQFNLPNPTQLNQTQPFNSAYPYFPIFILLVFKSISLFSHLYPSDSNLYPSIQIYILIFKSIS